MEAFGRAVNRIVARRPLRLGPLCRIVDVGRQAVLANTPT
jgi:hypothetical protein